jgi:S-formylglutathione hydrolase FrmB
MNDHIGRQRIAFWILTLIVAALATLAGCTKQRTERPDTPLLFPGTRLQQVTFHSNALGRDATYRFVVPEVVAASERLPVVYLLHGSDGGFHDWLNYSDVARYSVANKVVLVMPDAEDSYYTNSATRPGDRYEDFIIQDLIQDVETRIPIQRDRAHRAVIGVSMGGFGAVKLGLHHPELFAFVGGMSSALDVPSRPFSWKRIGSGDTTDPFLDRGMGNFKSKTIPSCLQHPLTATRFHTCI